jgi:hypothetical protein
MEGARLCFLTSSKGHSRYGCCDLEKDRNFGRLVNIIVIHHASIFNIGERAYEHVLLPHQEELKKL